MSKPICFKIRGGVEREDGSRGSTHIGKMAGKGYLGSEDMAFTCLATNDQYLFAGQGEGSYTYPLNKPPMKQRKLKYLSLFSGIEAASVAWKDLGWEPVGFAEIEPFPSAVLKHRFPNTPNSGDITKWKEWGLTPGTVDVVCAGSPCQAFSVAGLRKGLDDPRGNLALVTLGLVEFLKPKWFIWENVPGVLTAQSGSAFGAILTALGDIGYGWSYRVLDAQHFGVPQRRRRVWLCGYRDPVTGAADWRPPTAVLSFSESLRWNPAKSFKKRKSPAGDATGSPGADGVPSTDPAGCWWDGGQVSQTLDAVLSKGQTMPEKNRFPAVLQPVSHWNGGPHPTLNQSAKASGAIGYSNQELFSQGGGGLVPGDPTAFRKSKRAQSASDDETWVDDGKANTLNNFDLGDTRTTHAVVQPTAFSFDSLASNSMKSSNPHSGCREVDVSKTLDTTNPSPNKNQGGIAIVEQLPQGFSIREDSNNNTFHAKPVDVSHCVTSLQPSPQSQHAQNFIVEGVQHQAPGDVAPTVTSSGPPYSRTGNERVEADALAITFQPGNLRRDAGAEPSTTTVTTLKATMGDQMPHVAQVTNGDVIMENNRRDGLRIYEGTSPTLQAFMGTGGCNVPMIQPAMAVRRLTPTECLRLQGFPDDWTKIPWKGKSPEECPDGPQYKAAGNSWAVPCARYIGERINMVEEIKDELSQSQA
jgi:site-specific DNA-cytosine methylase